MKKLNKLSSGNMFGDSIMRPACTNVLCPCSCKPYRNATTDKNASSNYYEGNVWDDPYL